MGRLQRPLAPTFSIFCNLFTKLFRSSKYFPLLRKISRIVLTTLCFRPNLRDMEKIANQQARLSLHGSGKGTQAVSAWVPAPTGARDGQSPHQSRTRRRRSRANLERCPATHKTRFRDHKEAVAARHQAEASRRLHGDRSYRHERSSYPCQACRGEHLSTRPNATTTRPDIKPWPSAAKTHHRRGR